MEGPGDSKLIVCFLCKEIIENPYETEQILGEHAIIESKQCHAIITDCTKFEEHLLQHSEPNSPPSQEQNLGSFSLEVPQPISCLDCKEILENPTEQEKLIRKHADISCKYYNKLIDDCTKLKKLFDEHSKSNSPSSLDPDTESVSREEENRCNLCPKIFTTARQLNEHRDIHIDNKRFECQSCYRIFTKPSELKRHETIHTGSKKYQCKTCDRNFAWSGT